MKILKNRFGDLPLDYSMIQHDLDASLNKELRSAVRGIAFDGRKILVVFPENEVLYGTPGGGVEDGETLLETLNRELLEEVGAKSLDVVSFLGTIKEERVSNIKDAIFCPEMNYYLVNIKEFTEPELIDYEKELNLQSRFIDIDEVITHNQFVLSNSDSVYSPFYSFQTELFILLKEFFKL